MQTLSTHIGQETLSHLFILGVQKFGGLPFVPFVALSAFGDLIYQQALTSNMKSYKKLKKFEGFFSMTRSLSLAWTVGRLFQEFSKKTTFFPTSVLEIVKLSYARRVFHLPLTLAGLLFTGFITTVAIKKIDELVGFFHERGEAQELIGEEIVQSKGVTVSWEKPFFTEFNRGLLFLQTVTSVALAFFSKVNFSILAAVNGYSLYKMSSQQFFSMVKRTSDIYKQINVTFTYKSILLPKENKEKEPCNICINEEKKIYSMCENHAYCGACLTTIFAEKLKELTLINFYKHSTLNSQTKVQKITYECCVDLENLPSCPECRGSTVDQNELEIEIKESGEFLSSPAKIHYLNYAIGKTIWVKVGEIGKNEQGKYFAKGTLEDGTTVIFPNIDKGKADKLIQEKTTIRATISKKTTESRCLYLICVSETLPTLREYQIGEEVLVQNIICNKNMGCFSFFGEIADGRKICFLNLADSVDLNNVQEPLKGTITHFDEKFIYCASDLLSQKESYLNKSISFSISGFNEDENLYFGELDSGEKIYYFPLHEENIEIGSFVTGTVFDEIITSKCYVMDSSKYRVGTSFSVKKIILHQDEKFLKFPLCTEVKVESYTFQCFFSKNDYEKLCADQEMKFVLKIITSDDQGRTVLQACPEDSHLLDEDYDDSSEFNEDYESD